MKAIVYHRYGTPDEMHLEEVPRPTPKDNEVLVKIHASSVNAADGHFLRGTPFFVRAMAGVRKPKQPILGGDIAGRVEAVGSKVTRFQPGDEVFGDVADCGFGGFAEHVSVPADVLIAKPDNVSFEQAAAVPVAGLTALQALRTYGGLQAGQKVLVNGASGGVGSHAVQLAKALGAEVTAVCSTGKMELVRKLGADHVIDYTQEDFTKSGQRYDLILGVNGHHKLSAYKRALSPKGTYVAIGGTWGQIFGALFLGPFLSLFGRKKIKNMGSALTTPADLATLRDLLASGDITPEIDRRYPLEETADAMRYFNEGHTRGKVVITQ